MTILSVIAVKVYLKENSKDLEVEQKNGNRGFILKHFKLKKNKKKAMALKIAKKLLGITETKKSEHKRVCLQ